MTPFAYVQVYVCICIYVCTCLLGCICIMWLILVCGCIYAFCKAIDFYFIIPISYMMLLCLFCSHFVLEINLLDLIIVVIFSWYFSREHSHFI